MPSAKSSTDELPVKRFRNRVAWEAWLEKHHETSPGLWLELGKKGSGVATLSRADALEVALRFGWIDSQALTVDEKTFRQRFRNARARRHFEQLDGGNRYAILFRLHDAKTPETRARRLAKFIRMLEAGETLH